jgi:glutaredoxin-related protein
MEEWFIMQSFCHGLIRSAQEHLDAGAGGSLFNLSIEEAHKLVEIMASNESWDEEHTQTCTRKVHQLEEVDMLTAKIDLLMKKLENLGLDHLKMVDARVTCEECEKTRHMGINCLTVSQDVNFIGNSNKGFCPNQGFNAGWNKPSFPFDNRQQGGMGVGGR